MSTEFYDSQSNISEAVLTEEQRYQERLRELTEGDSSLEILVEMAKQGEINPWDVNLEQITDKFLNALNDTPSDNLREAGKAIFYASILLRMKSDILTNQANDALNIGFDEMTDEMLLEEELEEGRIKQVNFSDLERVLRRKHIQKAKRFRNITLEDLIGALNEARNEEEARQARAAQQSLFDEFIDDYEIVEPEVSDDMLELTHAENVEEAIERSRAFLSEYLIHNQINFKELVNFLGNWSNAFLSVLFLSHEQEVKLVQEEFYGELEIHEPKS